MTKEAVQPPAHNEVWVIAANRTPIGSFMGELSTLTAPQLGSAAISGCLRYAGLPADQNIDELFMGNVLSAGCGQAPARQAALGANLPYSVPCTTVNKVCGSGMKAVMLAVDSIQAGHGTTVIAGGMESMTNAPYLQTQARSGQRLGNAVLHDHMFIDGLLDAYEGNLMGLYAQQIADEKRYDRESMDAWAITSVKRAQHAQQMGWLKDEIVPICVTLRHDTRTLTADEHPQEIDMDKIPRLKPAFAVNGSVTAANSSAISDGAAALFLMDANVASAQGLKPLAIIRGHASHARAPSEFTVAPVFAIDVLLSQLDWQKDEVDAWEINEAFAVVTQIAMDALGLDPEKVNVCGGACALGHPIGASGARIIVTLIHQLCRLQAANVGVPQSMKGIAACCIGGGEATAIAVEVPAG
ncbi:thiolase family protein [Photobacterium japonica]|uniref:thiolase family protein n=1 Tax=Photobacterium japonica TaxID=2910235 RepID=UPI003D0AAF4D